MFDEGVSLVTIWKYFYGKEGVINVVAVDFAPAILAVTGKYFLTPKNPIV